MAQQLPRGLSCTWRSYEKGTSSLDHVGVPGAAVKDKKLDAGGLRALAVEKLES